LAKKKMLKNEPNFDAYLRHSYCDLKKTMKEIATEIGCSPATVLNHLRRCEIETRNTHDYETSEKVREAWVRIGKNSKGRKLSDEQKKNISQKRKGHVKRNDYEFYGHEKKRDDGYIAVYFPDHPEANSEGYVMKHRLVMEKALGYKIPNGFVVHHINHIRDDNRIENLALMLFGAHAGMHLRERQDRRKNN
jgi:hypothetical protein